MGTHAITTALVLAGGEGQRLQPLTADRPKPMVLVHDRPLLEYHLHWLRHQGVERAVLLVGYKWEVIQEYFSFPRVPGLTVEWVTEPSPLGRGGAIRNGIEQSGITDPWMVVTNGDVITNQPLAPVAALHQERRAQATVMLVPMVSPYGVVDVDEAGQIRSFQEKPELPYWINAGVYVLSKGVVSDFPKMGDHETTTFPNLAAEGTIAGYRSSAFWCSVETPKDLAEVASHLSDPDLFSPVVNA